MDQNHIDIAFPLLKKVETFQKHNKLRFDRLITSYKHCALILISFSKVGMGMKLYEIIFFLSYEVKNLSLCCKFTSKTEVL